MKCRAVEKPRAYILAKALFPEYSTDSGADDRQGAPTFVMSVTDTGHVGNRHSVCLYPPADIDTSVGLQYRQKINQVIIIIMEKGQRVSAL